MSESCELSCKAAGNCVASRWFAGPGERRIDADRPLRPAKERGVVDAEVDVRRAGGVAVAVLHGDYDLGNVAALYAELLEVLRVRPTGIVIDLGEAGFCDLTALRAMANIARRAAALGVWVRAAGPAPMVRRMLEITGLCACLPPFADVELALRGARGRVVLPAGRTSHIGEPDARIAGRTSALHATVSRSEVQP